MEPELILISTGAEVPTTLHAAQALAKDGVVVRVVSMPCMELFEAQSEEYRDEVLPPAVARPPRRRAGREHELVASGSALDGDVLGLDRFGASAPGTTVLEKLGFTDENIVARARALLAREPARSS